MPKKKQNKMKNGIILNSSVQKKKKEKNSLIIYEMFNYFSMVVVVHNVSYDIFFDGDNV